MKYEYKTTYGHLAYAYEDSNDPDDPEEPNGNGWELVNTTASQKYLYWTWRRPLIETEE